MCVKEIIEHKNGIYLPFNNYISSIVHVHSLRTYVIKKGQLSPITLVC